MFHFVGFVAAKIWGLCGDLGLLS